MRRAGADFTRLDGRACPPRGTRETASRSPDCAPSLRRVIPISALPEAESRVQSVLLDAVSMATESASLESVTHGNPSGARVVASVRAGADALEPF